MYRVLMRLATFALVVGTFATSARCQQQGHVGLPIDWSFRHVLAHGVSDRNSERLARREPRLIYGAIQHSRTRQSMRLPSPVRLPRLSPVRTKRNPNHTDWHFTLGAGTVAANMSPAKYTFDVNATPSCTNDYVVMGLNVPGSSTQPNLVGFTNLYSGTSTVFIASASESGTTVTIVTTAAHNFSSGASVTIAGISPAGYNGTFVITVTNSTTFTYTDVAGLGTATVTGATASQNGLCGTSPTVKFAYNTSTAGGLILTSPALSLDGTQVAFIESAASSAIFHVLTLGTTGDNGSFSTGTNQYAAVQPDNSGVVNNATLKSVTYSSTASNTRSSPYIDYLADVAYFGDDSGNVYKTTCVFVCATNGITLGIASGWPVNVGATTQLASPVVDTTTGNIFVGGANGVVYMIPLASCPGSGCSAAIKSATIGTTAANGGVVDGVLLDSTFQTVFATVGRNGTGNNAPAVAAQMNESMSVLTSFTMGPNQFSLANGALDDEYYNNAVGSTTASGNGYFCGPVTGNGQIGMYIVSFGATGPLSTSNPPVMTLTPISTQITSNPVGLPGTPSTPCNPIVIFTSGSMEHLFFSRTSVPKAGCPPSADGTDGCVSTYSITPSTGALTMGAATSVHGGASGMIVDNVSSQPQAASLYFGTLSTVAGSTTGASCTYTMSNTAAYCAVKVTQNGLQ